MEKSLLEQALRLPREEQLELADALWESASYRDPELTDEVRELLDERLRDMRDNPGAESTWPEARDRLYARLR
ncbi:hypothetical protein GCM10027064_25700 [Microbacterium petrolearium]